MDDVEPVDHMRYYQSDSSDGDDDDDEDEDEDVEEGTAMDVDSDSKNVDIKKNKDGQEGSASDVGVESASKGEAEGVCLRIVVWVLCVCFGWSVWEMRTCKRVSWL